VSPAPLSLICLGFLLGHPFAWVSLSHSMEVQVKEGVPLQIRSHKRRFKKGKDRNSLSQSYLGDL
jgi:hypothetical protein